MQTLFFNYFLASSKNKKTQQSKFQSGFTIIELMIVIVIIATLSAVAIPSFQNYIVRAKVTEAINALGPAKLTISEHFFSQGIPDSSYTIPSIQSKYVKGLTYTNQDENHGFISVQTQNLGSGLDDELEFSLYLHGSENGLEWDCAMSNNASKALDSKYLPAQCRDAAPDINDVSTYNN